MNEKMTRMEELIKILNEASSAYYNNGESNLSDREFDELFDELKRLEAEAGIVWENSPTKNVGARIETEDKVRHEYPARSLDKTKDRESLVKWLNGKEGALSWKMDGQTIQLTYIGGKLVTAATRGNGEIGKNILSKAPYIHGIPLEIPYCERDEKLVVRGESVMSYVEFDRINAQIEDPSEKYMNPRNLAVGTLNNLDLSVIQERRLDFFAFQVVANSRKRREGETFDDQMYLLEELGFQTVVYETVTPENVVDTIGRWERRVPNYLFPTDGLVLSYNDLDYGKSLGSTGHHPRHSIAFKWKDETVETKIVDVEWSPSKTGLLNPVAVFEPVEIEGTIVQRASVHNVSIFEQLALGVGDIVEVYKANMIIPQIHANQTKSGTLQAPDTCPVCGSPTKIESNVTAGKETKTLYCTNPDCSCKLLGKLEHFVTRNAMDIDGVSGKTIALLNEAGILNSFSDFYRLKDHRDTIQSLEGMGEIATNNLLDAIEKSRNTNVQKFCNALSIPLVGKDVSKLVFDRTDGDIQKFRKILLDPESILDIDGIGSVIVTNIKNWSEKEENIKELDSLISFLTFQRPEKKGNSLNGKTFVVTGSVTQFANRDALHAFIQEHGGKTAGSVSAKTSYLINNDTESTSGKNKKAKDLGIPIISEEEFLKMV